MDLFFQIINSYNRKNVFRYGYSLGNIYNGIDDDGDWEVKKHDKNGFEKIKKIPGPANFEYGGGMVSFTGF